jgi:preprotein translocase subunit SecA
MINTLLAKVIGTQNERELKRLRPLVARINELSRQSATCLTLTSARRRRS